MQTKKILASAAVLTIILVSAAHGQTAGGSGMSSGGTTGSNTANSARNAGVTGNSSITAPQTGSSSDSIPQATGTRANNYSPSSGDNGTISTKDLKIRSNVGDQGTFGSMDTNKDGILSDDELKNYSSGRR